MGVFEIIRPLSNPIALLFKRNRNNLSTYFCVPLSLKAWKSFIKSEREVFQLLDITICYPLFYFVGCQSSEEAVKPFADYFDMKAEIAHLAELKPLVEKSVIANGNEEVITDTISWEKEFALFLDADINSFSQKDNYVVAWDQPKSTGVVSTVTYTAKKENQPVQLVRQVFEGDNCQSIFIKKLVDNQLQNSYQELYYEPGVSYRILARHKVELAFETSFEINGRLVENAAEHWHASLNIGPETLPFQFELNRDADPFVRIINGSERILAENVSISGDSIVIDIPVFLSEIRGKFDNDNQITGYWHNISRGADYKIPFFAEMGKKERFEASYSDKNFAGNWEVDFSPGTDDHYKALGVFTQAGNKVEGTFLTETGDYRYLEGVATGDSLFLSCFDGAHAFLFKAGISETNTLAGSFWSGKHWLEPWEASRNEEFALIHPDSLTYLNEGYEKLAFSFPDLNGNMVSLSDEKFQDKVVIVQILGSWCPNCMDETAYLAELYDKYHEQGLEIVGLTFEKKHESEHARLAVEKLKSHFGAGYDFLMAGPASKKKAAEALPMLNHIVSFPTTVFMDRNGDITKIRTGFNGPGTGSVYEEYVSSTNAFVEMLLHGDKAALAAH